MARNLEAALAQLGDEDVVVLDVDSVATPGWLQQMSAHAGASPRSATLSPWSNGAGLCSFPRFADDNPTPDFPEAIAEAAASLGREPGPELPSVAGPCLFLRREAFRQLGGLDGRSFPGTAALEDFSRRAAAMGWSNQPCPSAFVVSLPSSAASEPLATGAGKLSARWPAWHDDVARFILADPMRPLRDRLQARVDELSRSGPQRDLFN
jgi:GT2 family glycosyltransferase